MTHPLLLGDKVRQARELHRMTLRALARAIGISPPFLSDVEHGRRSVSAATLSKLEKVLGVKLRGLTFSREDQRRLMGDPELLKLIKRCFERRSIRDLILKAGRSVL